MRDFYTAMKISPGARDDEIRAALVSVSAALRSDAELVLLNPKRRAVYDRNHRLLTTIGQLRSHLGLSYTRFWARQEYKDFWAEVTPVPQKPRGRRVDATLIAGAFRAAGRHGRKHVTRGANWLIAAMVICAFLVAYFIVRLAR